MSRRFTVGLTGGIASGKSVVAGWLEELGAAVVDTDVMAREQTAPGMPALAAIADALGENFLNDDGSLNRARLRQRVFADPQARKRLEAILHPRIREAAWKRAGATPGCYVVMVVPLLAETGFTRGIDRVLLIDAPREQQIKRLAGRDGASRPEARAIIAAQATRSQRKALANDILVNDGPLEHLRPQVETLHRQYLRAAGQQSRDGPEIAG